MPAPPIGHHIPRIIFCKGDEKERLRFALWVAASAATFSRPIQGLQPLALEPNEEFGTELLKPGSTSG